MCELYDVALRAGPEIDAARSLGEADAAAGRPIRRFDDADAGTAYRHAYALTSFHEVKAKLLGQATRLVGGAA